MNIKKLSKKVISLLLVAIMIMGSVPVMVDAASSEETPSNYFRYTKIGKGSCCGSWRRPATGIRIDGFARGMSERNLVIPKEIEGLPVKQIGRDAFSNRRIDTLKLPSTLESIDGSAFYKSGINTFIYTDMNNVSVANGAFRGNNIENMIVEEGVKVIKANDQLLEGLFLPSRGANNLKFTEFPKSLEKVEAGALSGIQSDRNRTEKIFVFPNPDTVLETSRKRAHSRCHWKTTPKKPFENISSKVVLVGFEPSTAYDYVEENDGILPEKKLGVSTFCCGPCYPSRPTSGGLEFRHILCLNRTINGKETVISNLDVGEEFTYNVKLDTKNYLKSGKIEIVEEFHELYESKDIEVVGARNAKKNISADGRKVTIELLIDENVDREIEIIFTGSLNMPSEGKVEDIVTNSIANIDVSGRSFSYKSNDTTIKDINTDIENVLLERTINGSDTEINDLKVNEEFTYNTKLNLGSYLNQSEVKLVEEFHELFNLKNIEVVGIDNKYNIIYENDSAVINIPVNNDTLNKEIEVIVTGSMNMPADEKSLDIVSKSILKGNNLDLESNETRINSLKTEGIDTTYELVVMADSERIYSQTITGKTGEENAPHYLNDLNSVQSEVVYKDVFYSEKVGRDIILMDNPQSNEPLNIDPSLNTRTLNYTKSNIKGNLLVKYVDEDGNEIASRNNKAGKLAGPELITAEYKDIDGYKLAEGQEQDPVLPVLMDKVVIHTFKYVKINEGKEVEEPEIEEPEVEEPEVEEPEVEEPEVEEPEVEEPEVEEPEYIRPEDQFKYKVGCYGAIITGFKSGKESKSIVIPKYIGSYRVSAICREAFMYDGIEEVSIPRYVNVGSNAFGHYNSPVMNWR